MRSLIRRVLLAAATWAYNPTQEHQRKVAKQQDWVRRFWLKEGNAIRRDWRKGLARLRKKERR